jgi:hypothetical protein
MSSIFVAEFGDVQTHGGLSVSAAPTPSPSTTAHVHVTRILRDALHLGLQPGEFDATLTQCFAGCFAGNTHYWSHRDVRSGQRYLVFSDSKLGLREMVADPAAATMIADEDDPVAEVELILSSASRSIFDQALGAAAVLAPTSKHSYLLAQYVAGLLASGSEADTGPLLSALEGPGALAFSDSAKISLLGYLSQNAHGWGKGRDNLLRVYVNLVTRYFVLDAKEWRPGITRLQVEIVTNHLSEILRSDRVSTLLRQFAQNRELRQELKSRASKCASDSRLTVGQRTQARQFASVLETI